MTRSLAIFGDSLMDARNLDQVANIVGQDPRCADTRLF
jgi:hypothetical protein